MADLVEDMARKFSGDDWTPPTGNAISRAWKAVAKDEQRAAVKVTTGKGGGEWEDPATVLVPKEYLIEFISNLVNDEVVHTVTVTR